MRWNNEASEECAECDELEKIGKTAIYLKTIDRSYPSPLAGHGF
jgi:hypothetical protein